jgi:tRNA nucleotidyltransferase/poly(A) polymerase
MRFYEVGGCIRDQFLGVKSKDVDFAVDMTEDFNGDLQAHDMYNVMRAQLSAMGFEEVDFTPDKFTVRSKVPESRSDLLERTRYADFVMCRKDGPYSDGRHPDYVLMGNLMDDLARRDFTMNAIARDVETGEIIDPFHGIDDIQSRTIRFVGNATQRITEDALRVMRALRFCITKDFDFDDQAYIALLSQHAADMLIELDDNRKREELNKMLVADSVGTMDMLFHTFYNLVPAIFNNKIRLEGTMKK